MSEIKDKILKEYENGNIIVAGVDGLQSMKLKDFIKQPISGMLYDLRLAAWHMQNGEGNAEFNEECDKLIKENK